MKKYFTMLVLAVILFGVWEACEARTVRGRVIRVSDGDTITILTRGRQQHKIRFYGIDAPELHQPYGQQSKEALERFVADRDVSVEELYADDYGRIVGLVNVDGVNVNAQMVKTGNAWVYTFFCKKRFCREWAASELAARRGRSGLWRWKNPVPPWDWRRASRKRH